MAFPLLSIIIAIIGIAILLGVAFLMFGLFNLIFIAGFFKTSYKFAKPFVTFIIVAFVIIVIVEVLWHIPGFEILNSFGFANLSLQLSLLAAGIACYIALTALALKSSAASFEETDL